MIFKILSITILLCSSFVAVAEDERSIEEKARAFANGTLGDEMDTEEAENYIDKRMKELAGEDGDEEAALERVQGRLRAMGIADPAEITYPRIRRIGLDYTHVDGYVKDDSSPQFIGAPNSRGSTNANVWRIGSIIDITENLSTGISLSTVDGDSDLRQGTPGTTNSTDTDSDGGSLSLSYRIKPWLSVGGYYGLNVGSGNSLDDATPANAGSFKTRSWSQGVYLSAYHNFTPQFSYAVAPSYSHSKTKSKYQNPTLGRIVSNYSTSMYHLDQNLSYYFNTLSFRATGGYTHHYISSQTENGNAADQSKHTGTLYVGGRYYFKQGYEIYSMFSHEVGDSTYDDKYTITAGAAITW